MTLPEIKDHIKTLNPDMPNIQVYVLLREVLVARLSVNYTK